MDVALCRVKFLYNKLLTVQGICDKEGVLHSLIDDHICDVDWLQFILVGDHIGIERTDENPFLKEDLEEGFKETEGLGRVDDLNVNRF